jgi:tetratricopeptide (TPR) repeat protein
MLSADQLHRRGVNAINAGKVRVARPLLERGLERATDEDLKARIEASLAYVAAETGDPAGGLALCGAALARQGLRSETRGIVQSQRALLQMRSGDTPGALTSFGQAIDFLASLPDEKARAHLNRGGVYLQQGAGDVAAADFAAAMRDFEAAGLMAEVPKAQHNLGYAAFVQGDLVSALRDMEEAGHNLPASSPVLRAISQQDRAEVLMAAGLTRQGLAALDEAARTLGQHRLHQRRGEAELTIARAALARDPARALVAARAARGRFDRVRTPALRLKAEALAHGAEVRLGRTRPSLVQRGDDLAAELDGLQLRWWALDIRLDTALVALRRGDYDEARVRLRTLRVPRTAPLAVRLRDRDVRAALAERSGRPAAALGHLRRGLADLHEWQSSFGSLDLQTMVTGHGRRLAVRGLRVATESKSPEVLFEWSERARMLASRVQPVRVPHDEEVVADLAELRTLAAKEEATREDRAHEAELRQRVRERAWRTRGSGAYDEPMPLADLQGRLGDRVALLAHVITAERVVALVVTSTGATTRDLGPTAALDSLLGGLLPGLDMAAAHLPDSFAQTVRAESTSRLMRLDELLLAPLADELGDRQLVLTPSGVLAAVPWTLLPTNRGRPVIVAESATSWAARTETPLRSGSAGFVAGPRVPQAESETNAASKVWPDSQLLHGTEASADAVSRLAGEVDVLHVSAHGRHSSENPLFSGFELADGPWFGYDIDQLDRVPDVVLLSACEVGRSTLRGGEELIGMTAAWLHAGARCVVASAAAINDEVAHDVLVRVHEGLADGYRPAAALARALLDVDPEGPPAPLVVFG